MNSVLKISLLLVFAVLFAKPIMAQTGKVEYVRNEDKSVTFSFQKLEPGSRFVMLKFTSLKNSNSKDLKKQIKGYSGSLGTLRPLNKEQGISFGYTYKSYVGNVKTEPNLNFKYNLPFSKGKNIDVRSLGNLSNSFGGDLPKNWSAFQFLTQKNDTVRAIRKGTVVKIIDGNTASADLEYSFKSRANAIIIEHDDGTLANYSVLKDNSFMVKLGDTVYPTMPLAQVGTYDKDENAQLRLYIYYLNQKVKELAFDAPSTMTKRHNLYNYVNPIFIVNNNETSKLVPFESYTSYFDEAIISAEMKKREIKQWKKGKLPLKY